MIATGQLLDFVRAEHALPDDVRADALRLLGDTLVVGAAGATAPGAEAVLAAARGWGLSGEARLLGSPPTVRAEPVQALSSSREETGSTSIDSGRTEANVERLPAAGAAFVNGFRIHCLEWDAVHEPAVVHALSVVTAALGAAIDRKGGADREDALIALAVGVEVASGLGVAATSPLSFFRPATAGCIGAALAVARIEGVAALADVLGLAYSFCAGTMQAHVEGSIALPLQVANAARSAIMAVDLVKAGLTGPHDAIEGPFGYFKLIDRGDPAVLAEGLGKRWRISEVSTKPYPCGRASHAVLGTLADLGEVERIEARVPQLIVRLVGRPCKPGMTPAYARLCLPLLSALMRLDRRIDPRRFTPETFADPQVAALASSLTIVVDDNPDPNALFPQTLIADGREIAIPHTLGSPAAPLTPVQVAAKRALARELAADADPRIFDDPLAYFTDPR